MSSLILVFKCVAIIFSAIASVVVLYWGYRILEYNTREMIKAIKKLREK